VPVVAALDHFDLMYGYFFDRINVWLLGTTFEFEMTKLQIQKMGHIAVLMEYIDPAICPIPIERDIFSTDFRG
jgi:hypothetical protein